ncbi:Polar-differentiation response regulator DivK [Gemmata sp. SH-PL17]|nr:Polar-differentiation response regulator DivK [Gemmata sp. SH-PL17]
MFRVVGLGARACYSGKAALVAATEFRPILCLLDLTMPEMDGDELAVRLRTQTGALPLMQVAVTALDNDVSQERIKAAGFDRYLVKPVEPVKLLALVDRV